VNEIVERSKEASLKISENAKKLVENRRVITHSCSSTVIEILKAKGVNVIVSESRPLYEGRRVARELSEFGIPVTLITDASVGYFASKADIALVGADTILADGSLVNKMGTYLLALSSRKSNVPFYVACELDKLSSYSPREIELEEKEASEVLSEKLPNVTIRNIYFDITPAELVTKIITEKGMMEPYEAVDYAREMEEHLKQIYSE
jgi:translation initiation factor 2B subunit (eIF-2B alpha/beta/delta family)